MFTHHQSRCRGFTLVELLVVIGIIAVLISLLLPALNSSRKQASAVKCLSNLRQIMQGATLYASTFNNALPWQIYPDWTTTGYPAGTQSTHWYKLLTPYLGKTNYRDTATGQNRRYDAYDAPDSTQMAQVIYNACPEWDSTLMWTNGLGTSKPGYGMNARPRLKFVGPNSWDVINTSWGPMPDDEFPAVENNSGPVRLSQLRPGSEFVMFGDSVDFHLHLSFSSTPNRWDFPLNSGAGADTRLLSTYRSGDPIRHGRKTNLFANYVFADSSARSLGIEEARKALLRMQ
jgi:prepilin-type N-terminal cleavage/methylation domain-containing protein